MKSSPIKRLLTDRDASGYIGVCPRTLWALANSGKVPFCKINRSVRYDVRDLDAFIESTKQTRGAK